MPSTSEKQARFMAAAAHNPEFAKKVGISQDVAKDFNKADTGSKLLSDANKKRKTFKEWVEESVADVSLLKRKPLLKRTPREQAAINAAKESKPKTGKVEVHLKHEDGTISKSKFKLMKRQDKWEDEADEVAKGHLKNMQNMKDKFPDISGSRAISIHKVEIK